MNAPLFTDHELDVIYQALAAARDNARHRLERERQAIARHNMKLRNPDLPKSFADASFEERAVNDIAHAEAIMAKLEAELGYPRTVAVCPASPANDGEASRTS